MMTTTMTDTTGAVGQRLSLRLGKVDCPGMVIAYFPKTQKHRILLQGTDGSSREKNFRLPDVDYSWTQEDAAAAPSSVVSFDLALRRDAVGRRLEIYHQVRNKWYQGTILRYVEHCQQHTLLLEPAGKVHLVDLSQQVWRFTDLVSPAQQPQETQSLATSRYMGVQRFTESTWKSCYTPEQLYIGCFGTEKDAALAYDVYARKRSTPVNFEDRRICRRVIKQLLVPEPKEKPVTVVSSKEEELTTPVSSESTTSAPASLVATLPQSTPEPEPTISSLNRVASTTRLVVRLRLPAAIERTISSDDAPPALLEEKHTDDSRSEATPTEAARIEATPTEVGAGDTESRSAPVGKKKKVVNAPAPKAKKVQKHPQPVPLTKEKKAAKQSQPATKEKKAAKQSQPVSVTKEKKVVKQPAPAPATKESVPVTREKKAEKQPVPATKEKKVQIQSQPLPVTKEKKVAKHPTPAPATNESAPVTKEKKDEKQPAPATKEKKAKKQSRPVPATKEKKVAKQPHSAPVTTKEKKVEKQSHSAPVTTKENVSKKRPLIDMIDAESELSASSTTSKPRLHISVEEDDDDSIVGVRAKKPLMSTKKAASSVQDDSECEFEIGDEEEEDEESSGISSSEDEMDFIAPEVEDDEVVVSPPRKRIVSKKQKKRAKPSAANLFDSSDEEDEQEERALAYQMNKKARARALLQEIGDFNAPPVREKKDMKKSKRKRPIYPIGTRFLKKFPGYGTFEGHITLWDGKHYHVYYPEDGDREEFGQKEMSKYKIVRIPNEASDTDTHDHKIKKKKRKVHIE